jgi:hypothetical protein
MNKVLIFSWAGSVKLEKYGYQHNAVVEEDLHTLIDFFLGKKLKVMISVSDPILGIAEHEYTLFVDDRLFTQR